MRGWILSFAFFVRQVVDLNQKSLSFVFAIVPFVQFLISAIVLAKQQVTLA